MPLFEMRIKGTVIVNARDLDEARGEAEDLIANYPCGLGFELVEI